MANQLWLLRHGEAEPHGTRADSERRLTERGEAQSRAAGRALAALELTFPYVFMSPKVRARDTALLACENMSAPAPEPVEHAPLSEGFGVADVRELLLTAGPDARVLVVGHNPDFAQVVYDLTGARVDFKKGGLAGVRVEGTMGELLVLLRPREIDRLAGD